MQVIKEPQALHYWKWCKLLPLPCRNDNKTMPRPPPLSEAAALNAGAGRALRAAEAQQPKALGAAVLPRGLSSTRQLVSGQPEGPAAVQVATAFWMLKAARKTKRVLPKETVNPLALFFSSQESRSLPLVQGEHIHAAFCPCGQRRKLISPALLQHRLPGRRTQRETTTGSQDTWKIWRNPHFTHRELSRGFAHES